MFGGLLYNLLLFPPTKKELSHQNKHQEECENKSYVSNNSLASVAESSSKNIAKKLDLFEKNASSYSASKKQKNYLVSNDTSLSASTSSLSHKHTSSQLTSHTFQNPAFIVENDGI